MDKNTMIDVQEKVQFTLQRIPAARDSDQLLYALVCELYNKNVQKFPFHTVMEHYKELGIPKYDSVARARRRLQRKYENLRGVTYHARMAEEKEYRAEYAEDK